MIMYGSTSFYHNYTIPELEEYKEAILKTLEYVKRESLNSGFLYTGFRLGGNSFETERYLEQQISSIDAEIQKMSNPNNTQLFSQMGLLSHVYTSSSKNSKINELEERMDKIERKTDDVREEVNQRLEEKMPRIDRVNNYLDSFEAEIKYNKDEDETE